MSVGRRKTHPTIILAIALVAQFMVILDVSVVNVALPSIRTALHFTENNLQWVVSAYTVTFAGFLMLGGRSGDLLGRKRMFIVGVSMFAFASLLGALATTTGLLIGARALQGVGGAVVAPATLSIITTTFAEGPARNRALGLWGAVSGAGGSAGVLFGGILTDALSWRWILLINVPIGLALLPFAFRYLHESHGTLEHRHFDAAGAITITGGIVALVLGIVNIESAGWTSPQVLISLAAAVVLLTLFVLVESRWAKAPLIPLQVFSSRTLTGANIVMLLTGAAMFSLWFFLSLYNQQVLGMTPLQAGLAFLPMTVVLAVTATLVPRVVARIGGRLTLLIGMGLLTLGCLLLTQISATGTWAGDVLVPSVITALGLGFAFVPVTIAAVAGVPREQAGLASGLINTARQMGGAIGLAILTTSAASLTSRYTHAHPGVGPLDAEALTHGYQGAFFIAAGFAVCGGIATFVLLRDLRVPRRAVVVEDPA